MTVSPAEAQSALPALIALTAPGSGMPVPDDVPPAYLLACARRHGMLLLLGRIADQRSGPGAAALRAVIGARRRDRVVAGMILAADLSRMAAALAVAGLSWRCLKGPALSQRLYGTPVARDSVDLDILVRRDDLAAVGRILTDIGFQHVNEWGPDFMEGRLPYLDAREYNLTMRCVRTGTMLEVHWRWSRVDGLAPMDPALIWTDHSHVMIGAQEVPVLNPVMDLVYLCTHAARHGCGQLKWLQDMRQILAADTDGRILAGALDLAQRQDVLGGVGACLLLAARLDGQVPPILVSLADRSATVRRLASIFDRELRAVPPTRPWMAATARFVRHWRLQHLLLAAKQRPRRRESWRRILTASPAERAVLPLPAGLSWLYTPLRPFLRLAALFRR